MQWDASPNAGFTSGEPWLLVNPNCWEINAEDQVGRADSVFTCYQKLIRLRKELPILSTGNFEPLLEEDEHIFAYRRRAGDSALLVVCNFSGESVEDPLFGEEKGGELLVSSYSDTPADPSVLRPYEAKMLRFG